MLYFNRVDSFEGIDVNKTSESKECNICHYLHFLDKEFKFQADVCNGCQDVLMMSMKLSNIDIPNIQGADYCCILAKAIN